MGVRIFYIFRGYFSLTGIFHITINYSLVSRGIFAPSLGIFTISRAWLEEILSLILEGYFYQHFFVTTSFLSFLYYVFII